MTSRIGYLAIDVADPAVVADFWCAVLGWRVVERGDEGVSIGPADDGPGGVAPGGVAPGGVGLGIDLLRVPERKTVKNRLHLDLRADGSSTAEELARLQALGAVRVDVGQPPDASFVVLADPEGNEFCLLARSVQELP